MAPGLSTVGVAIGQETNKFAVLHSDTRHECHVLNSTPLLVAVAGVVVDACRPVVVLKCPGLDVLLSYAMKTSLEPREPR